MLIYKHLKSHLHNKNFKNIVPVLICLLFNILELNAQIPDSASTSLKVELGEVEVTGQRIPAVYSQVGRKVTVIDRKEIESLPVSSIQDILEYSAGIDIRQRNTHGVQADIQFRGGTFDEVMVLLNGTNITDPQTGHFNLDLPVELHSIERIEILHGSGARVYGANAYKGVINIITKNDETILSAGIKAGEHGLFNVNGSAALTTGQLSNSINISRNSSCGFAQNTDYKINNLYYQGDLRIPAINFNWQAGINNKAFGANDFYSPSFPDEYEETGTMFASAGFKTKGVLKISGTGYWRQHKDHFLLKKDDPSFYENFHLTNVFGLRVNSVFSTLLGKSSIGFDLREENILSNQLGEALQTSVAIRNETGKFYTKSFSRNTSGLFLEHSITANNFSVTTGFLLDLNNAYKNKTGFFPGIDLSYHFPNGTSKLFASANRSLRLPKFTDMFYSDPGNQGNPSLVPEELFAIETGIESISSFYTYSLSLFRDKSNNAIDWVWQSDANVYRAMNITTITTHGLELSGELRFKSDKNYPVTIKKSGFSFTYTGSEKGTVGYESKYALDYLRHKLRFYIDNGIAKNLDLNLELLYQSRNGSYIDYDPATKTKFLTSFKPYWLADMRITYSKDPLKTFVEISNLFNARYTDVGNLFQPGRWITCGIQIISRPSRRHSS